SNVLLEEGEVNLKGTKVGNAPQTSFGFGFKYTIWDALTIDADYNIYANLYGFVDARDVVHSSQAGTVYQAERLPSYDLLDAGITYRFRFGTSDMVIRGNVYNLANRMYLSQKDSFGYFWGN